MPIEPPSKFKIPRNIRPKIIIQRGNSLKRSDFGETQKIKSEESKLFI